MNTLCRALLSAAALAPPAAAGSVWEVGGGGLPTIGAALDLASDGDVILVHAGSYPGFIVDAQSLAIVADEGESVSVGAVVVQRLSAAQSVTLQGLMISGSSGSPGVRATSNDGALWLEDCQVRASPWSVVDMPALEAVACASVVLRRSTFEGSHGTDHSGTGGSGVVLRDLFAAVFSCSITGGIGGVGGDASDCTCTSEPGGPGGNGLLAENSVVLVQSSTIQGGVGGYGDCCYSPSYCGHGGDGGLGFSGIGPSQVTLVQSALIGGAGGSGGGPVCGDGLDGWASFGGLVLELPEVARQLEASSPLREGQIASAIASGEPSELMAVYAAHGPAFTGAASIYGFVLLGPPVVLLGAAVLPASGTFQLQAPVPELGASVAGLELRLQTVSLTPGGGFVLGEAAALVLLDAGI